MILRELVTKLSFILNLSGFKKAESAIKALRSNITRFTLVAGGIGAPIYAILKTARATAEMGDKFHDLSNQTGISASALQKLDFIFQHNGASIENFTTGIRIFSQRLLDARRGSKDAIGTFSMLGGGVDILKDSNLKLEDALLKTGFALYKIKDSTTRVALAQELFGRGGAALLPVFSEGEEGLLKLSRRFDELGLEMMPAAIAASDKYLDTLLEFKYALKAFRNMIGGVLIPILTKFFLALTNIISVITKVSKAISGFIADWVSYSKTFKVLVIGLSGAGSAYLIFSGRVLKATVALASFLKKSMLVSAVYSKWIVIFALLFLIFDDIIGSMTGLESAGERVVNYFARNFKWFEKFIDLGARVINLFKEVTGFGFPKAIIKQPEVVGAQALAQRPVTEARIPQMAAIPSIAAPSISINSSPTINISGATTSPTLTADLISKKVREANEEMLRSASRAFLRR